MILESKKCFHLMFELCLNNIKVQKCKNCLNFSKKLLEKVPVFFKLDFQALMCIRIQKFEIWNIKKIHRISGDYCSVRTHTCCENRDDDCTVPILGDHLCYCDMFCDRGPDGGNIIFVILFAESFRQK